MTASDLNNLLLRIEILARKNWLHAMHLISEAMEAFPRDPRIHAAKGHILFEQQDYKNASKSFQRAYELGSKDHQVIYMLANSYFVQGEFRMALTYYNLIPVESVELSYNRALAMANLGKTQDSIDLLIRTLALFPPQIFVYILLVEQLLKVGESQKALKYLQDGENRLGGSGSIYLLKAMIHTKLENWLPAYHAYSKADSARQLLFPDHLAQYAHCAGRIGLIDRAIAIYERSLDLGSYNAYVYEDYAKLLVENNRYAQAKKLMSRYTRKFGRLNQVMKLIKSRIVDPKEQD